MDNFQITREQVVEIARSWLGTPYIHQACLKHVGCDCLGLIRGVWKDIYGVESEEPPPYTPYWAEQGQNGQEPMLEAATKYMQSKHVDDILPGDVLLIRVHPRSAVKHCGIMSYDGKIIHAYDLHAVVEEHLHVNWKRRQMFAFQLPGVIE